jgi:hypothetical protein
MQNYLPIVIWNKIPESSDDKLLVDKQSPTVWIDNKSGFCVFIRDLSSL